jgi:hypothetical protein
MTQLAARDEACMPQGFSARSSLSTYGWEHAVAESVVHTLQTAWTDLEDGETHEQAQTVVFEDIAVFYHRQRCLRRQP